MIWNNWTFFIFSNFSPIKPKVFGIFIWNSHILLYFMYNYNIFNRFIQKLILVIYWPYNLWKIIRVDSKTFFNRPFLGQLFSNIGETWYCYDQGSKIFNLSSWTQDFYFYLNKSILRPNNLSRPELEPIWLRDSKIP